MTQPLVYMFGESMLVLFVSSFIVCLLFVLLLFVRLVLFNYLELDYTVIQCIFLF